ncbi:uncharacterized protein LOC8023368 isoform X5 [Ixodes scapularis]|uniref:uncharacterized protein LOC8023368 isoform X5 n=1 Tax=Ixodes scapularis TaxID=6945 RepID=UPI001A9F97A9|nr:uncharacterized protein LOC8023368 isoform X5 [Ixodes scapularis]
MHSGLIFSRACVTLRLLREVNFFSESVGAYTTVRLLETLFGTRAVPESETYFPERERQQDMFMFNCSSCCRRPRDLEEGSSSIEDPVGYPPRTFLARLELQAPVLSSWIHALHLGLHRAWPSPGRGTGLDLCCGPTLHHAAVLSKFLANVYLADPEQANRNALQAWICREPGCPDYSPFLAMVSAVEALPSTMGLAHVETRLRSALRGVLECNLGHPHLLPSVHRLFRLDVVVLLASALQDQSPEPAAQVQVLRRVGRRLRRGGLLALVGVAPPGPAPKNALEDAMLAAGYANLCWEARDMVPLGSCPSTRSFLLLANKLWQA